MPHCVIALGSNLGDRKSYIDFALVELAKQCSILCTSKLYETKPVGYLGQGDFLNAAVLMETSLEPLELLSFMQGIENTAKRERPFKNAPRTLDLDIIFYEDVQMDNEVLKIPHPLWQYRAFVVEPLLDLCEANPEILAKFALEKISLSEILKGIKEKL